MRLGETVLLVHNRRVAARLKPTYGCAELQAWRDWLLEEGVTRLELTRQGLVRAAERVGEQAEDPIQYDAVWVRDAAWGALALLAMPGRARDGGRVVAALLDSFATPAQLARFDAVIATPELVAATNPDAGMNAVHIRFDGRSPTFDDVTLDGRPQGWNHKQNDALGLFLIAYDQALIQGVTEPRGHERWAALARFAAYFEAIAYHQQEDAGAWEEIERLNTSSVGIVAHALDLLATPRHDELRRWAAAEAPDVARSLDPAHLRVLAELGRARVRRQLPGGESPDYPPDSPRHRGADAALLNLVAPAPLAGLTSEEQDLAVAHVETLVRPAGVIRYVGDSYQSANAWFLPDWEVAPEAVLAVARLQATDVPTTASTASGQAFLDRAARFAPDTEAQWFFDSWLCWARAVRFGRTGEAHHLAAAFHHLNRALGQITADAPGLAADGRPGQHRSLPESYNTLIFPDGSRRLVMSPVAPLNWSRATMVLALEALLRLT